MLVVDVWTLTAAQLQTLFETGQLTSVDAVKLYLAQISKHSRAGVHRNAIISVVERDSILACAGPGRLFRRQRCCGCCLVAPVSLGTGLDGSIVMPAARAGVCAVKLTPESVDNDGFQPGALYWDSQGPYAKTATDTPTLSVILQLHDPGYYHPLTTSWSGLKATTTRKVWKPGRDTTITQGEYDRNSKALRAAASNTLLSMMKEYEVDVLLRPCNSRFASVGAAAGFPVGLADFNERPFSLHAIAPGNKEAEIFQVISAWEASFPDNVRAPPLLVGSFPVEQIVMGDVY
ncbi:hypothetical protein ACJ41O_003328 [Fusarium nematophilum]